MSGTLSLGTLVVHINGDAKHLHNIMGGVTKVIRSSVEAIERYAKRAAIVTAGIGAASVREYSKFNQAMVQSLAIMKDVSPAMQKDMEKMAITMSKKSRVSAEGLASAYFHLASAGMDAAQSIQALGIIEKFAVAGMFNVAHATEMLTTAQGALGLRTKDAVANAQSLARVSDVLVRANTLAEATTQEFAMALTRGAGPAIRIYNLELEEGVAALAAYARQGIKAEHAGEMFSRFIRLAVQGFNKERGAWKRFGVNLYDAAGKLKPLWTIVDDFTKLLGPMSTQMRTATLTMMGFEARSQNAIFPLVGMSKQIKEFYDKLKETRFTQEVYNKQMTSFSSQMKILWNNVKAVGIAIGEHLAPSLIELSGAFVKNQKKVEFWATYITDRIIFVQKVLWKLVKWMMGDFSGAFAAIWDLIINMTKAFGKSMYVVGVGIGKGIMKGIKEGLFSSNLPPFEDVKKRYEKLKQGKGDVKERIGIIGHPGQPNQKILSQEAFMVNKDLWQEAVEQVSAEKAVEKSESLFDSMTEQIVDNYKKAWEDSAKQFPDLSKLVEGPLENLRKKDEERINKYLSNEEEVQEAAKKTTNGVVKQIDTFLQAQTAYKKTIRMLEELRTKYKSLESFLRTGKNPITGEPLENMSDKEIRQLEKKRILFERQIEKVEAKKKKMEDDYAEAKRRAEAKRNKSKVDEGFAQEAKAAQFMVDAFAEEYEFVRKIEEVSIRTKVLFQTIAEFITSNVGEQQELVAFMESKLESLIELAKDLKEYIKTPQQLIEDFQKNVMSLVKLGLLTAEEAAKAIAKKGTEMFDMKGGSGLAISSQISAAGLSIGGDLNPMVVEQRKTNQILQEIERNQRIEQQEQKV